MTENTTQLSRQRHPATHRDLTPKPTANPNRTQTQQPIREAKQSPIRIWIHNHLVPCRHRRSMDHDGGGLNNGVDGHRKEKTREPIDRKTTTVRNHRRGGRREQRRRDDADGHRRSTHHLTVEATSCTFEVGLREGKGWVRGGCVCLERRQRDFLRENQS